MIIPYVTDDPSRARDTGETLCIIIKNKTLYHITHSPVSSCILYYITNLDDKEVKVMIFCCLHKIIDMIEMQYFFL